MSKLILFLLMSSFMFGQTENERAIDSSMTEPVLVKDNIGVLGYQFQHGKFYNIRISDAWRLQTGLFNTNSDNFKIVELPFLVKHDFTKNFRGFFGSKAQIVIDNGFSTLQPLSTGSKSFGASAEFGLQYDVSEKVMIEFRYSLPIMEQSILYPSTPNLGSGGMFYLGSGFKF